MDRLTSKGSVSHSASLSPLTMLPFYIRQYNQKNAVPSTADNMMAAVGASPMRTGPVATKSEQFSSSTPPKAASQEGEQHSLVLEESLSSNAKDGAASQEEEQLSLVIEASLSSDAKECASRTLEDSHFEEAITLSKAPQELGANECKRSYLDVTSGDNADAEVIARVVEESLMPFSPWNEQQQLREAVEEEEEEEDKEAPEDLPLTLTERSVHDARLLSFLPSRTTPKDMPPMSTLPKSTLPKSEDTTTPPRLSLGDDKAAESSQSRESSIVAGAALLVGRLASLGLVEEKMADDGNCQFRALAQELYADSNLHRSVRKAVVAYLAANPKDFKAFVGTDEDW
jgi:hypothetical protein